MAISGCSIIPQGTCLTMVTFAATLFIIAEDGCSPDVPQLESAYRTWRTSTQWGITQWLFKKDTMTFCKLGIRGILDLEKLSCSTNNSEILQEQTQANTYQERREVISNARKFSPKQHSINRSKGRTHSFKKVRQQLWGRTLSGLAMKACQRLYNFHGLKINDWRTCRK